MAADLEKIAAKVAAKDTSPGAASRIEALKQLGVMNLRDFVVEQKEVGGKTLSRAALTFSESDDGIPSWPAAPGPIGALDFVSPNAKKIFRSRRLKIRTVHHSLKGLETPRILINY